MCRTVVLVIKAYCFFTLSLPSPLGLLKLPNVTTNSSSWDYSHPIILHRISNLRLVEYIRLQRTLVDTVAVVYSTKFK